MGEAEMEQMDTAHYNHNLLIPKRLSGLSGISCCSLMSLLLIHFPASLGNAETVRPAQPGFQLAVSKQC